MSDARTGAPTSKWANRFVFAAILQGLLALGLTAYLLYHAVFGQPAASRIVAGGGAGMWMTVGYLGYLTLGLVGTAVTAQMYRHLEAYLSKPFTGRSQVFPWLHLILWNVGVTGATWLMINAGYRGGAAAIGTQFGGLGYNAGQVHTIMVAYTLWIAATMAVALAGAFLGIVGYLLVWARPAKAAIRLPVSAA
ncbi:MAG: hypothetical protein AABY30_02890 [Candidatus Thermoplasmatota archaeon]